jgi:uncharacterized protein YwgA
MSILPQSLHNTISENHTEKPSKEQSIMITAEQATILGILKHADTPLNTKQRLQKYVFLLDEALGDTYSLYTWKTSEYGPYSTQLQQDIEKLDSKNLLTSKTQQTFGGDTRYKYILTNNGENTLNDILGLEDDFSEIMEYVKELIAEHDDTPISNIIHNVLDEHVEYRNDA